MSDLDQFLKAAEQSWREAYHSAGDGSGGGFVEWPDGQYTVVIQNAELRRSQSEKLMVMFEFLALDGPQKGEVLRKPQMVESQRGREIFFEQMRKIGFDISEDIHEARDQIEELSNAGAVIVMRLRSRGEYQNFNFISREEDVDTSVKSALKTPEEEAKEDEVLDLFREGDSVVYDDDGETYRGTVSEKKPGGFVTVKFEDGDTYDLPAADLRPAPVVTPAKKKAKKRTKKTG